MRILQNAGLYAGYRDRLNRLAAGANTFQQRLRVFLEDRYGACHVLQPVIAGDADAFFTNADDEPLQRAWAREHGLHANATLADILLSQIEAHRTEVFYNLDPMRFGNDFLVRLPGCVRHTIAWRAAPSAGGKFDKHDLLVCNFPGIIAGYRAQGWRAEYFAPSYDPEMDPYARNVDRPVDVLFVGSYSRHHRKRAEILEAVSALAGRHRVVFHLDSSRLTRVAESLPGRLLPLARHRRPAAIRTVASAPVFGRELYQAISKARLVVNGAIDMAGEDRGNMRCFEAMGCGALMISDRGNYPSGMVDGETMLAYGSAAEAVAQIESVLADPALGARIAGAGHEMLRTRYAKAAQWEHFRALVSSL